MMPDLSITNRYGGSGPAAPKVARRRRQVLRTLIDTIGEREAMDRILRWARHHESRYVVFANVHVAVEASVDPGYGKVVDGADMAAPEGAPVAWMLRRLGHAGQQRLHGPDLMWALLERCAIDEVAVYFYGGTPATLRRLLARVADVFPTLEVAGAESPPFRSLADDEDELVLRRINRSGAGVVFVGLDCPKQERWMAAHRDRIHSVMLGVGAAFDFHPGTVNRAPAWMCNHGLEWLYRLASEPRRLWKRYLLTNVVFMFGAARQLLTQRAPGK